MKNAFQLSNVTFIRDNQRILNKINLMIPKGCIYGFLGPNGAGKTTLMKLVLNLLHPTEGSIEVLDQQVTPRSYSYLKLIGSIIETPVFYNHLTVAKNLELHCQYAGIYDQTKIDQKLALVKLLNVKDKKVKELSLGMKQRLAIARALLTEPELLILDEPINGLDPFGIKEIRELLIQINRESGTTIFISSHIITEIESMCDVIGFIQAGEIIKELTIQEIKDASKQYLELTVDPIEQASQILDSLLGVENFKVIADQTIRIYDPSVTQSEVIDVLVSNGILLKAINERSGDLEAYFVKLMNEGEKV